MKIGIIAALPGELKPLVKGWYRKPHTGRGVYVWQRPYHAREVTAACAGMGAGSVGRALAAVERGHRVDAIISVGWAGALTAEIPAARCLAVAEVIDARTGERFEIEHDGRGERLVTAPRVADAAEKQRLQQTYGAALVDMEAAALARLALMRRIPMYCFKAVSDGVQAHLPDLNPFISREGALHTGSLVAHVAFRPRYWRSMAELGRTSKAAADNLGRCVGDFLSARDDGGEGL